MGTIARELVTYADIPDDRDAWADATSKVEIHRWSVGAERRTEYVVSWEPDDALGDGALEDLEESFPQLGEAIARAQELLEHGDMDSESVPWHIGEVSA